MRSRTWIALSGLLCLAAHADTVSEVEPNDRRATAQPVTLICGDQLTGTSTGLDQFPLTGETTVDHFLIETNSSVGTLRRYRFTVAAPDRDLSLRGRTPSSATADALLQGGYPDAGGGRHVTWYGLGAGGVDRMNVRVGGDETTTAPYVGTLECAPVTPALLSHILPAGVVRIRAPGAGNVTLYDSIQTNQPGWTANNLSLTYGPGLFTIGVSTGTIYGPNSGTAQTISPGMTATQASGTNLDTTVEIYAGPNQTLHYSQPIHFGEPGDIAWVQFYVSGSGAGACCVGTGCTANVTSADCTTAGGVFLGGGVPCNLEMCTRACCYPDGECRLLTPSDCNVTGGAVLALGSTCATANCPAPMGAGCANPIVVTLPAEFPYLDSRSSCGMFRSAGCTSQDEDVIYRLNITAPVCLRVDLETAATPHLGLSSGCPPCSVGNASFVEFQSLSTGTYWLSVRPSPCAAYTLSITTCPPRACCFDDGSCQMLAPADCAAASGHVQAANSTCAANICPPAITCCLANTTCQMITWSACYTVGGRPLPGASSCVPNICVEQRACCLPSAGCTDVLVAQCLLQNGTPLAAGSACPATCQAVCLRGDVNCDGAVNNFDIDPFVVAIINSGDPTPPTAWTSTPECWLIRTCSCDVSHDSAFNTFDIDPFVACMVTTRPPGQPCP